MTARKANPTVSIHYLLAPLLPDLPGAVCAQVGYPELFFPNDPDAYPVDVATAKKVCERCPERVPCLAFAMANPVDGIWGGTTTSERRDLRRRSMRVVA